MKIHASGEDYLKAILILQQKTGAVRSVDLARYMGFTKASISYAVSLLRSGGFILVDDAGFLNLTEIGRELAESIYEKHCFFTAALTMIGVDPKTAEEDACRLEHIISEESFDRLKAAFEKKDHEDQSAD